MQWFTFGFLIRPVNRISKWGSRLGSTRTPHLCIANKALRVTVDLLNSMMMLLQLLRRLQAELLDTVFNIPILTA